MNSAAPSFTCIFREDLTPNLCLQICKCGDKFFYNIRYLAENAEGALRFTKEGVTFPVDHTSAVVDLITSFYDTEADLSLGYLACNVGNVTYGCHRLTNNLSSIMLCVAKNAFFGTSVIFNEPAFRALNKTFRLVLTGSIKVSYTISMLYINNVYMVFLY